MWSSTRRPSKDWCTLSSSDPHRSFETSEWLRPQLKRRTDAGPDTVGPVLKRLLFDCAQGDEQAFTRLYRLTSARLYGFALRILRDEGRAQECLQEAYVRIWAHSRDYRPDKGAPMTWMGTIVRRCALDMVRSRSREHSTEDLEWLLDLNQQRGTSQVDAADLKAVQACLEQIRREQREALLSAYYEGLTHPELAERLQVPLGTVKTWVRRALAQIRRCLEQ